MVQDRYINGKPAGKPTLLVDPEDVTDQLWWAKKVRNLLSQATGELGMYVYAYEGDPYGPADLSIRGLMEAYVGVNYVLVKHIKDLERHNAATNTGGSEHANNDNP